MSNYRQQILLGFALCGDIRNFSAKTGNKRNPTFEYCPAQHQPTVNYHPGQDSRWSTIINCSLFHNKNFERFQYRQTMEKAKNIIEFADNFDPSQPLGKEDSDAYVPIYDDILAKLCDRIVYDKLPSRTLFVAGQSGTGKTTALNFLPDEEIEKKYFVKTINFRDLIDLSDIDIIDVLLMIGFELVKGSDLEGKYFTNLEKIRKIHKGVLKQETTIDQSRKASSEAKTEASASAGFFDFLKLKASFFASYRLEKSYRDTAREAFELRKPELLQTINELIED